MVEGWNEYVGRWGMVTRCVMSTTERYRRRGLVIQNEYSILVSVWLGFMGPNGMSRFQLFFGESDDEAFFLSNGGTMSKTRPPKRSLALGPNRIFSSLLRVRNINF